LFAFVRSAFTFATAETRVLFAASIAFVFFAKSASVSVFASIAANSFVSASVSAVSAFSTPGHAASLTGAGRVVLPMRSTRSVRSVRTASSVGAANVAVSFFFSAALRALR
jgi:hypothetical protein